MPLTFKALHWTKRNWGWEGGRVDTHIVMEGFGLAGVITCVPSFWGRTVQIPKYTVTQLIAKQQFSYHKNNSSKQTLKKHLNT